MGTYGCCYKQSLKFGIYLLFWFHASFGHDALNMVIGCSCMLKSKLLSWFTFHLRADDRFHMLAALNPFLFCHCLTLTDVLKLRFVGFSFTFICMPEVDGPLGSWCSADTHVALLGSLVPPSVNYVSAGF